MGRFTDRVAVVTGAGSGIGKATAMRLGSEGATVACLDVNGDACTATAEALTAAGGGKGTGYACDVSDPASVEAVVAKVAAELGPPYVLGNIAGIGTFAHTIDQPVEEWQRILAVNLTGSFLMARATLPHLLETGGNIVNIASSAGIVGQPFSAAYCASKGGVIMLTKSLANEFVGRGVRVNAVAPGGIDTPIIDSFALPEGANRRMLARIMSPLGYGRAEDVAALIAFIASDEAAYMTGSIVSFDGGITS
ncbi:MAG: SDR family oxidoreductase [Actinomycetota bacterium]|nr:SDR family oxidoreductase [Actinomycetota bacterium]